LRTARGIAAAASLKEELPLRLLLVIAGIFRGVCAAASLKRVLDTVDNQRMLGLPRRLVAASLKRGTVRVHFRGVTAAASLKYADDVT
jgi:hypothetical protein